MQFDCFKHLEKYSEDYENKINPRFLVRGRILKMGEDI
jgi:hypothetical protein